MDIVPGDEMKERKEIEKHLLDELDKYKIFGKLNRAFRVAKPSKLSIDAIGKHGGITYIIEAKRELNHTAIGQVFVYEYAYKEDPANPEHKQENTRKVIVCNGVDVDKSEFKAIFFFTCLAYGIDVIEITDKDIKKNGKVIVEKKPA